MRPLRPEVTAIFSQVRFVLSVIHRYQYMKYAVCKMNIKISPDHKLNPKPISNPSPFPIPNPMPLTYDFSLTL